MPPSRSPLHQPAAFQTRRVSERGGDGVAGGIKSATKMAVGTVRASEGDEEAESIGAGGAERRAMGVEKDGSGGARVRGGGRTSDGSSSSGEDASTATRASRGEECSASMARRSSSSSSHAEKEGAEPAEKSAEGVAGATSTWPSGSGALVGTPSDMETAGVRGAREDVVGGAAGGEEMTASADGAAETGAMTAGAAEGSVQPVVSLRDKESALAPPVNASAGEDREVSAPRVVVGNASTIATSVVGAGEGSPEVGLETVS